MSSFGLPPANSPGPNAPFGSSGSTTTQYSRVDLQAAFNWLVNQPDHVRKQASDPDRLMTLYYRSSGRATSHSETTRVDSMRSESVRVESSRMENEAPVSSQNFLSDLRQINEALRQFETPGSQSHVQSQNQSQTYIPHSTANHSSTQQTVIHTAPPTVHIHNSVPQVTAHAGAIGMALNGRTQAVLMEVREKLNLSSETEALQMLVAIGYKQLKPMID